MEKELENIKNNTQPREEKYVIQENKKKQIEKSTINYKPGSFGSIIELTKMVFHDFAKSRREQKEEFEKDPKKCYSNCTYNNSSYYNWDYLMVYSIHKWLDERTTI